MRLNFDLLRLNFDLLRLDVDLLRLDVDLLRLDVDLLRLNVDLLRLDFDLLRLNFDLLRLNFDLLKLNFKTYQKLGSEAVCFTQCFKVMSNEWMKNGYLLITYYSLLLLKSAFRSVSMSTLKFNAPKIYYLHEKQLKAC
ncbi:hypothetical protein ANSO36C_06600 [Nostoc cf. commune SO-36]|uniref:Uncharacterized protein n=1 Tax=Nostoc cf. commune SO-36 TaxID=449208 RepID=A0ABM7YW55_NOSCO|nr:hypothetical protein [Nostoc commune]BDI14858.1 hypothetical protein ANSO36C_06600 [Nostoc cf. commune SO-36]